MAINQSVCFGCFARGGRSAEEVIAEAARSGYKSVEMLPREHWQTVRDHGMRVAVVVGHNSLPDGLNKRENHDRIEDELLANIELAAAEGLRGNGRAKVASWKGGANLAALAGRTVRLRFALRDMKLYAFQFTGAAA